MGVSAINKRKIVHKKTNKFTRFEYEDYRGKMSASWRRPRGIDCCVRRKYRGTKRMVKIGYGSNKRTRYVMPNGFKKMLISNKQDLETLLMNNRVFCGELAHNLSAKTRKELVKRAHELNVNLTNSKGRVSKEEQKADN